MRAGETGLVQLGEELAFEDLTAAPQDCKEVV